MLVCYLPVVKSGVLEERDPESRIYYADDCQRKKNETSKNVMQLYHKLITEVMKNKVDFFTKCVQLHFLTFSLGVVLAEDLYQIVSLSSAVGKQN